MGIFNDFTLWQFFPLLSSLISKILLLKTQQCLWQQHTDVFLTVFHRNYLFLIKTSLFFHLHKEARDDHDGEVMNMGRECRAHSKNELMAMHWNLPFLC